MIFAAILLATVPPPTGDSVIDRFVADLGAGRREAAIGRIHEMNSLSGRPNAVALASELVDMLMGCTLQASERSRLGDGMWQLRWRCRDGDYAALLDSTFRAPQLVVGEFLSVAAIEARRAEPMTAPMPSRLGPPPDMSDDAKIRVVSDYLDVIQPGGSALRAYINFRLHFMDRRQGDAFISPGQLGQFLASCRRAGAPLVPRTGPYSRGVITRFTCAGRGALATELTTIIYPQEGRINGGAVLVGSVPQLVE